MTSLNSLNRFGEAKILVNFPLPKRKLSQKFKATINSKKRHEKSDSTASNSRQNGGSQNGGQNHDFVNQRKVSNEDSLVQIYVPPTNDESDDDTLSVDSQLPDDPQDSGQLTANDRTVSEPAVSSHLTKKTVVLRTLSAEVASRKVPPMLSDWNRSQSFPPPKGPTTSEAGFHSDGLQQLEERSVTESSMSVKNNDVDGNYIHVLHSVEIRSIGVGDSSNWGTAAICKLTTTPATTYYLNSNFLPKLKRLFFKC